MKGVAGEDRRLHGVGYRNGGARSLNRFAHPRPIPDPGRYIVSEEAYSARWREHRRHVSLAGPRMDPARQRRI